MQSLSAEIGGAAQKILSIFLRLTTLATLPPRSQ
jgi:hypothetical protein